MWYRKTIQKKKKNQKPQKVAHNFSANLFLTDEEIQENKKEMLKKKRIEFNS